MHLFEKKTAPSLKTAKSLRGSWWCTPAEYVLSPLRRTAKYSW